MVRKKRVYKKGAEGSEYDAYHATEMQKDRRADRNRERRKALREGRVEKGDSKELHHVDAPRTGDLSKVKTRVVSKKTNRSIQPARNKD